MGLPGGRSAHAILLTFLLLGALGLVLPATGQAVLSDVPDETGVVANDDVLDIAIAANGDTYIAGDFSSIGTRSGTGVAFSEATGAWDQGVAEFAGGRVWDVVPDGSGGFFVGGSFDHVGGQARFGLVHILADGTSETGFPAASGSIYALAVDGTTLYVGGQFSTLGGISRSNLAAIDITTGNVTSWIASPAPGVVNAIGTDGGYVYTGHSRFDKATGAVDAGAPARTIRSARSPEPRPASISVATSAKPVDSPVTTSQPSTGAPVPRSRVSTPTPTAGSTTCCRKTATCSSAAASARLAVPLAKALPGSILPPGWPIHGTPT